MRALNTKDNHEILMCVDELEITISIDNRGISPVLKSQSNTISLLLWKLDLLLQVNPYLSLVPGRPCHHHLDFVLDLHDTFTEGLKLRQKINFYQLGIRNLG